MPKRKATEKTFLSDALVNRLTKPPKTPTFWNGNATDEDPGTDTVTPGFVFLTDAERAVIAGNLYRLGQRYPLNSGWMNKTRTQALLNGADQIMSSRGVLFEGSIGTPIDGSFHNTLDMILFNAGTPEAPIYVPKIRSIVTPPNNLWSSSNVLFRAHPTASGYNLDFSINGGLNWTLTGYGLPGIWRVVAGTVKLDDAAHTVAGSFNIDYHASTDPDNYVQYDQVNLVLSKDVIAGLINQTITMLDPIIRLPKDDPTVAWSASVGGGYQVQFGLPRARNFSIGDVSALLPKDAPTVNIRENAATGDKIIDIGLPRAQKTTFLPIIELPAGYPIQIAASLDTNGDLVEQLYLPRPADGQPGYFDLDDAPPAAGQTKEYSLMVDATGTALPFVIPTGYKAQVLSTKGLWFNAIADFREAQKYSNGTHDPGSGTFPKPGDLVLLVSNSDGPNVDGYYTVPETYLDPFAEFTATHETRAYLKQYAVSSIQPGGGLTGNIGVGQLLARIRVIGVTDAWCHDVDFTLTDDGWVVGDQVFTWSQWVENSGWNSLCAANYGGTQAVIIKKVLASPTVITKVTVDYDEVFTGLQPDAYHNYLKDDTTEFHTWASANATGQTHTWNGERTIAGKLEIGLFATRNGCANGSASLYHAHFEGTGINPFGESNC